MKIKALENLFTLHHKVTIYVPATVDVDKEVDNSVQVDAAAALLSGLFGGATSSPAVGYWLTSSGQLVKEKTTVVFAFADEKALEDGADKVVDFCRNLKEEMRQEAIALEIDGAMYFI